MSSVDIIVPCYGYGRYLRECVASILTQPIQNLRVLIIDDASSDDTAEIAAGLVKEDDRVYYSHHSINKGHIQTYNEGIEWATAECLLLLSADDYLLPNSLHRAVRLMEACPEIGLTFGNAVEIDFHGGQRLTNCVPCQGDERILTGAEFIALSGPRNIVPTPTAIVRTVLQKKLGGYRKELPHTADMELWLRLAVHAPVGFIRTPQAVYRRHGSNMSLSYSTQRFLPDLEQRKAALRYFFQTCGHLIVNSAQVQQALLCSLALDAVGFASEAFNHDDQVRVEQLSAFASCTSPKVKTSLAWAKLIAKRCVGVQIWRACQIRIGSMLQFIEVIIRSAIGSPSSNSVLSDRESQRISEADRLNPGEVS